VVFTQDPEASLGSLPLWHLELILEVWADRYRVLGKRYYNNIYIEAAAPESSPHPFSSPSRHTRIARPTPDL